MKIITLFTKMQVISKKTYIYGIFHKKSCQITTLTASSSYGNRTHESAVRGRRLDPLTNEPYVLA